MRFVGEAVGVADAPDVGGVEVVELAGQGGERGRRGVAGESGCAGGAGGRFRGAALVPGTVGDERATIPEFSAERAPSSTAGWCRL